jgi:hypothetical protein
MAESSAIQPPSDASTEDDRACLARVGRRSPCLSFRAWSPGSLRAISLFGGTTMKYQDELANLSSFHAQQ